MAEFSSLQKNNKAADPAFRTYQLAEQQYQTARTVSRTMSGAGTVLVYLSLVQVVLVFGGAFIVLHVILFAVSGTFGLVLLCAGRQMKRSSLIFKATADEQRQLEDDLLTWFLTTYSCDQIDHQIEALTSMGDSVDISYLKRTDMIRILFTREYDTSFDEVFLTQLCDDVYQMLYGSLSAAGAESAGNV